MLVQVDLRKNKRIVYFPLDKSHHIALLSSGRQEILHSTLKHNILFHMINVSSSSPRHFLPFSFFFCFLILSHPLQTNSPLVFLFLASMARHRSNRNQKKKKKKDVTGEIFFLLSIQLSIFSTWNLPFF